MNHRVEALYMTLSGYSKEIYDGKDSSYDATVYKIASYMHREFKKKTKLYSSSDAKIIIDVLNIWNDIFKDKPTSPTILLVITMYYLLEECNHRRTRVLFGHYKNDVIRLFNSIELSDFKVNLYEHIELLDKFIEER